MRLVYEFLRLLCLVGNWIYFERQTIIGRERLWLQGPAIVIVNHPNCFTDVIVPAPFVSSPMHFLGNYSLFKNPIAGFLLRNSFGIPIQRPQDVDGRPLQNDEAFRACDEFLAQKRGVLFIAPEGTSWMERRVRELKTGTARIAFSAEMHKNWRLGLKILPIGLTYSAPNRFRSRVLINVGEPVEAVRWQAEHEKDPKAAVVALTDHLERTLKDLTIDCPTEDDEKFQRRLETVLSNDVELDDREQFFETQKIWIERRNDSALRSAATVYFERLEAAGLDDRALKNAIVPRNPLRGAFEGLKTALLAPFAAVGAALWAAPCFLAWAAVKGLRLYVGYDSTVKFLVGLFAVPAMWRAVYLCSKKMSLNNWESMLCVLLTLPLGFAAWAFCKAAKRFFEDRKARNFVRKNAEAARELQAARQAVALSLAL